MRGLSSYELALSLSLHAMLLGALAATAPFTAKPAAPIHVKIVEQAAGVGASRPRSPAQAPAAPAAKAVAAAPRHARRKTRAAAPSPQPTPAASAPVIAKAAVPGGAVGGTAAGDRGTAGHGPRLIRESVQEPDYGRDAVADAYEGVLVVEVVVDASGRVTQVRLLNPTGYALDAGVLDAARLARYEPAANGAGVLVASRTRLQFDFRLH